MTPQAAAAEIDRTAHQVRRRARWQGWLLLAVAIVNFAFMVTPFLAGAWRWLRS